MRGPTVVEFAIATPQPYGISMTRRVLAKVRNQQLAPLARESGAMSTARPTKQGAAKRRG